MRQTSAKIEDTIMSSLNSPSIEYDTNNMSIVQVFVFKGEECLGWDCFYKDSISVGRSSDADVYLESKDVADIHAVVYLKRNQILISPKSSDNNISVNGKQVGSCILRSFDFITIGPYTLKVKKPKVSENLPVQQSCSDDIKKDSDNRSENSITRLTEDEKICDLNENAAEIKICESSEEYDNSSERILEENEINKIDKEVEPHVHKEVEALKAEETANPSATKVIIDTYDSVPSDLFRQGKTKDRFETSPPKSHEIPENSAFSQIKENSDHKSIEDRSYHSVDHSDIEEEEEEIEEEHVTPFLKNTLVGGNEPQLRSSVKKNVVEIVKCKGETVIDVWLLNPSEKYYIKGEHGVFCLVDYKTSQKCRFFFNDNISGKIHDTTGGDIKLCDLRIPENLHRKKKKIFSHSFPRGGNVYLEDGYYGYFLRIVPENTSPKVAERKKDKNPYYKNLARSAGFHFLILMFLGLLASPPDAPQAPEAEGRFVKIDSSQLKKTEPVKPPKPIQKFRPKPKPAAKSTKSLKLAGKTKSVTSISPKAGGGSGKKGNVLNRNVTQAGLLGLISDSIGFTPKQALATVTNLDVVSSPVNSSKTYKVGGITGKLPSGKIEIPAGKVVRSNGSQQVLRSVGVAGSGTVAALKKGKTGQNQVMGMVSVDLDNKARVQGGMSREAVKEVIDEHLDEISFCYENALMDSPTLMGNIVFEWKILLSGKVGEIRIKSSTVRSGELHSCIKAAIKTWQFPEPENSQVIVSYPFVFDIVGF